MGVRETIRREEYAAGEDAVIGQDLSILFFEICIYILCFSFLFGFGYRYGRSQVERKFNY
jgi:hypothetical protein